MGFDLSAIQSCYNKSHLLLVATQGLTEAKHKATENLV